LALRVPTERFLTFLTSLETEMAPGGCGLSDRDHVELIYHLRAVAEILRNSEKADLPRGEELNAQGNVGVGTTVHDPLSLKVSMKLMDLGRLPLPLLNRIEERSTIKLQC
jgi:hypothetical protein